MIISSHDTPVSIAVDLKKYRIRIHKQTLTYLGVPEYVQLLFHPTNMTLAILGTDHKSPEAHKVQSTRFLSDNSYEIYSKSLMTGLQKHVKGLDNGSSYRIQGKILAQQNIAVFSLSTMQEISKASGGH